MESKKRREILRKSLLLLFCFAACMGVYCQNEVTIAPEIDRMIQAVIDKNRNQEVVKAWRIQVAAFNDRREMEKEKIIFENLFPHLPLEWIYNNPYYILKVRDSVFEERIDALYLLYQIKKRYPSALLIQDEVKRERLLNNPY